MDQKRKKDIYNKYFFFNIINQYKGIQEDFTKYNECIF